MAASADTGFIQERPRLGNQFVGDHSLRRILDAFVPHSTLQPALDDLIAFGDKVVSPQVLGWAEDAAKNVPYIEQYDDFGHRVDRLVTTHGWKMMKDFSAREGIVAIGYERQYGEYSRIIQYTKFALFCPSSALYSCPLSMTDAAARCIEIYGDDKLKPYLTRLTTRDPGKFWTSGQWMTERSGGSDVSGTETFAERSGGESWSISGFKWFSSATDSNMAVLLATTPGSASLSLFHAETAGNDPNGLNGIRIHRLKKKVGTKQLPTAELELHRMKARIVGKEGRGVAQIGSVLNLTRLHNVISAVGSMRRALEIAKAFARVRKVKTGPLHMNPLHLEVLARMSCELHGWTFLMLYISSLLGREECCNDTDASIMLRLLTPIAKGTVCKATVTNLQEAMEALGGVGYLENRGEINIETLFRDSLVLQIWEGTTNIQGLDLLRVLQSGAITTLSKWIGDSLGESDLASVYRTRYGRWLDNVKDSDTTNARYILLEIGYIVVGVLLVKDTQRKEDTPEGRALACELARRWCMEVMDSQLAKGNFVKSAGRFEWSMFLLILIRIVLTKTGVSCLAILLEQSYNEIHTGQNLGWCKVR